MWLVLFGCWLFSSWLLCGRGLGGCSFRGGWLLCSGSLGGLFGVGISLLGGSLLGRGCLGGCDWLLVGRAVVGGSLVGGSLISSCNSSLPEKFLLPCGQRFDGRNVASLGGLVVTNDEAFGDGIRDDTSQQPNGTNCIVVTGNRVGDVVRVRVGVEDSDDGDAELGCLTHREVFALGVNNPQRAGGLGEVTNSTERLVELDELAALHEEFLLGEALGRVIEVDLFQFLHALEAAEDGLEVGEKSTEPTLVDVGLSDAAGF